MSMRSSYVVHFSEIALKGKNRPDFIRVLRRNLIRSLQGLSPEVRLTDGRFFVTAEGPGTEVARRLKGTFGVSWFSTASFVEPKYQMILPQVLHAAKDSNGRTFKVEPRRSDKSFPLSSHELAVKLGDAVAADSGMSVDLSSPDVTIHVDVTRSRAVVYSAKESGPGGLPVGTAGRVLHLFSGGIDSPVAAWLLMKRGCVPIYLHFYLAPTVRTPLESKITGLVKVLSSSCGKSTLVLVPFAEYQLATSDAPSDLEPSLFRRFMRMVAEELARRFEAVAIGTGDSLSQAASQTIWNVSSFDAGSSLPILRPLLTYDKEEIVSLAKRIGTYDLSLEDYKDCCAMITRHPRTRVKAEVLAEYVNRLGLQDLVWKSLQRATLATYNPAGDVTKHSPLAESPAGPLAPSKG
jgi:tRNA uracil 4-sulfurtransferase